MSEVAEVKHEEDHLRDRSHVIVVGVDGSSGSVCALEWAAGQAEITGNSLEVVSTWDWPVGWGYAAIPQDYEPVDDLEKVLAPILSTLRMNHPTVNVVEKILEGHPVPVLVEESRGASLLVVGSRGLGDLWECSSAQRVSIA